MNRGVRITNLRHAIITLDERLPLPTKQQIADYLDGFSSIDYLNLRLPDKCEKGLSCFRKTGRDLSPTSSYSDASIDSETYERLEDQSWASSFSE